MVKAEELLRLFEEIKKRGLTPEHEQRILKEIVGSQTHEVKSVKDGYFPESFYDKSDLLVLQSFRLNPTPPPYAALQTLDDLLKRDEQRKKDGFFKKIKIGQIVRPGKGGKNKVVVVPSTTEDKLVHDNRVDEMSEEGGESGGSGEGEEGEIIGEGPLYPRESDGQGAGTGEGAEHDIESNAYNLGKILTEKFKLPNLKEKGKKKALKKYVYDLTDRHRGAGQFLDKKATLKKIVETNLALGRLKDTKNIDPSKFLVGPSDKVYRVLSQEKDYESQALVFFLRDYSGSMMGRVTEVVVTKDVFIYSWLNYQYQKLVESRFILHDTEAKEVPDFDTYYNSSVGGGTEVYTAFELVNKIVEEEDLAKDYNIYVCYGTDGDDWSEGERTIKELEKMLTYVNRIGITVVRNSWGGRGDTTVEGYLESSGLLELFPDLIRMDVMDESADEKRIIAGIIKLFSEEKVEEE